MIDEKDKKYSIYHYLYGNTCTTFSDGWPSRSKSDAPIYVGTKQQCYNWLKSQFVDAAITLADINANVVLDFNDDGKLELLIIVQKFCADDTRYYFRSMYHAEM